MPAFSHCDLTLGTGLNNGTDWANAYQGVAGLVTGVAALAAGETLYVKNAVNTTSGGNFNGPTTSNWN